MWAAFQGVRHPDVFGVAIPFSCGVCGVAVPDSPVPASAGPAARFYFLAGRLETRFHEQTLGAANRLRAAGYDAVFRERVAGHDDLMWNEQFVDALRWAFGGVAGAGAEVRGRIVPLVDHHQHLMSARAVPLAPASAPLVELPAELASVIGARDRVAATGDPGDLFVPDALILDPVRGIWLQGEEGVNEIAGMYSSDTRFFANGYSLDDSLAVVTGVIRSGDYMADELTVTLGLERDASGAWRIATEAASLLPPRAYAAEVDADHLISILDAVGIQRAVVLSVAYWFGSPNSRWPGDEYKNTRAENDWTAAQAARYPDRLVAFCGIAPLRHYAEAEVRRCASELGMAGVKLHFQSSGVDLHDPDHVARVRRVFEVANELGLALVVHSRTRADFGAYDGDEAEIVLNELVAAAPDVPVQIAHLWGGNDVSEGALAVFADAVSSGDPRARTLYFDLTEVGRVANTDEKREMIARYARQIGMDRLLYGSDMDASPDLPPSTLGWSQLMRVLPLTEAEFADIADNVAPYLR